MVLYLLNPPLCSITLTKFVYLSFGAEQVVCIQLLEIIY